MKVKITKNNPFGVVLEAFNPDQLIQEMSTSFLKELFHEEHLIVLRGFKTFEATLKGAEDFSNYCERFGEVSVWPFGKVLDLVKHQNPEDHIFDNNYVPLHWDGMYRPQVPEFQIFHCVNAPRMGEGGRTTFSNTELVLKNTPDSTLKIWNKVTGHYQRKMEFYDSKVVSPILTKHPYTGVPVIRYNEPPKQELRPFLNPPVLEFTGLAENELKDFHLSLQKALYSPAHFYAHEWQTGDLVIADNHTLLHGRESFETKTPRHLRRVHVLGDKPLLNPHLVFHR